jgi:uncharacterized protein YfaS (alpha-2-macroglobulin family)
MINKKFITVILLSTIFSIPLMAQSYSTLWEHFGKAHDKDLPKEELAILSRIKDKARGDKAYGQLLKAELQTVSVQSLLSPDSLDSQLEHYKKLAASTDDIVLNAVYCSTLGHIYKSYWNVLDIENDSVQAISARYYKQSLRHPKLLAAAKAGTYEPLVVDGNNSLMFDDDLLHVLAMEAQEYGIMHDYYKSVGNRRAACISALYQLQKERTDEVRLTTKSKYLASIDSLIHEYQDLPECGELAIEHFNFMDAATDASAQEKIEYIDYALIHWPTWPRMAVLKNARSRITLPSFHAVIPKTLATPGTAIPVYITSLTHLDRLNVNVYKVNITGADRFDPNDANDYKLLRSKLSERPVYSDSKVYYGLPDYLEVRDTLTIAPLSVGVYMAEFTTGNNNVPVERVMINISNLRLISMNMPGNKMRMAVVNATTGKPIAGAKINIKFRGWKNRKWQEDELTLTTEKDGEVSFSSTLPPTEYLITTDADKAFPWQNIGYMMWQVGNNKADRTVINNAKLYTDRVIYRPSQKVKVAVLAYDSYSREVWKAAEKRTVRLTLRNAKYEKVAEKNVVTDEWGVASAEFDLPDDGNTGYFSITASIADNAVGSCSFSVEEYKRPTFIVEFDEYKDAYGEGDTIVVTGRAKTYSGVAVQNAKMKYNVRSNYMFWRYFGNNNTSREYYRGEAVTDSEGAFSIKVPIQMPDNRNIGNRFARVAVDATVTDKAGESRSAKSYYPLSDKPTAFVLADFDDKQCREQQKTFKFAYLNNAGKEIDADMTYSIDGGTPVALKTNTDTQLNLSGIASGRHTLTAFCEKDTLKQDFIVFSLKDTKAPVDTAAWCYSTAGQESLYAMKEGVAEQIQIGTSKDDQTLFYAIATDSTLLESGQTVLSNKLINRSFKYKKEWGDGIAIRYTWVRDGELYSFEQRFARPTMENKLTVEWKTFRDRLTPGQKEEWTMTVKDADGKPAKAQVMAVMYDKSLDALIPHNWSFDHIVSFNPPTILDMARYDKRQVNLYGEQKFKPLTEPRLDFSHLDIPEIFSDNAADEIFITGYGRPKGGRRPMMTARAMNLMAKVQVGGGSNEAVEEVAYDAAAESSANQKTMTMPTEEVDAQPTVSVRENLNETAFFMPQLITDNAGNAAVKFTLPESVTTWRFMSLAHDRQMNVGSLVGEVIAQKKLMIQPNMPRFIREGDKAQMSAMIINNCKNDLSGKATLQLINPSDDKIAAVCESNFSVRVGQQTSVKFEIPDNLAADVYICKVTAQTTGCSDGEQHLLPILSNNVEVTTTRAFTQVKPSEKTIDLNALYGSNSTKESLKVEYTNNPAWLMIEALPAVGKPDAENAISLATALYANSITARLKEQLPSDTALNKLSGVSADILIGRLANLQNYNGSFSWFNGMQPSPYVTEAVAKLLARMKHLGLAEKSINPMLDKAMKYLDKEMGVYVASLKKLEKTSKIKPILSDMACDYLYIQAISGSEIAGNAASNAGYLLSLIDKTSQKLTIYGKANMAVILAKHPVQTNKTMAKQLLESVRQYTVKTEEMGRYFDTPKARYSWRDYKIPTQTAAIEALQALEPDDRQTIADMQQWLLQEKHTQQWNTPLNSASAIYAFFNGWNFKNKTNSVAEQTKAVEATRLYVDNSLLTGGTSVEGKGYFSKTLTGRHSTFKAVKTSDNISWGAVYATCTQPMEDVQDAGESISVKREILDEKGNKLTSVPAVGQKLKVRLTVVAHRDLDFVEITDNRAACLEPVNQTSGYGRGYFESPRDNKTVFYFDKLAKGKHVVETDYYVDRAGSYKSGIVTAKCLYAPEFQARGKAFNIEIK